MSNKVRFGLKNVHYAPMTIGANNAVTYGTPVKIPGAVNLSLSKSSEDLTFYADDGVYFYIGDESAFDGDLEMALIPDTFRQDAMGDTLDDNGVLFTEADQERKPFALLFEFTGDKKGIRHVLYNCTASQSELAGETKGESLEVHTETLNLRARPHPTTNRVKCKTGDTTTATVYDDWYNAVYEPTVTPTTGG